MDGPERLEVTARHPDRGAGEAAADEHEQQPDRQREHDARDPLVPSLRPLAPPVAAAHPIDRICRLTPAAATRRRHEKTPCARNAACARSLSRRSRASASTSLAAAARTTTVALALRSVTYTSPSVASRSLSTTAVRSLLKGTCTVISATFSRLRIVALRMVSEASFSFGITSRSPFSTRTNV